MAHSSCQQRSLPMTSYEEKKIQDRLRIAVRRAAAKATGAKIPGDDWAKKNPDRHRKNTAKWRGENPEKAMQIYRDNQRTSRSTPWGQITNRMWPTIHSALRSETPRFGKYNVALGYPWPALRSHLESQFTDGMTWHNWGSVWELDHIRPLSGFQYTSLDDPLFKECWALSNLRPLLRDANQKKGAKEAVWSTQKELQ